MSQTVVPTYFSGLIQDGRIYDMAGTCYGVATSVYQELVKKHDELSKSYVEYQQMLIELGEIDPPPLPPEEEFKRQAEQMKQMQKVHADEMRQMQTGMVQMSQQMQMLMEALNGRNVGYSESSGSGPEMVRFDEPSLPDNKRNPAKPSGPPRVPKSTQRKDK